jgi:hypothetical protein
METNQNENLARACCLRLLGAKAEAAAIAAKRRSEFDALIHKRYSLDEDDLDGNDSFSQLYKLANSTVVKGNEVIARRAEELGMTLQLGPSLKIDYGDYPQYVQHCSESEWQKALRKIRRLEREAAAQIERTAMDTLIQLTDPCLAPADARKLLEAIPAAAELVPELKLDDLEREPDHDTDEEARSPCFRLDHDGIPDPRDGPCGHRRRP